MTSPKNISKLALIISVVSVVGILPMLFFRPDWGAATWWPAVGLGLAFLLLVTAYLRGAYLAAQQRAAMVDQLNDCYRGVKAAEEERA